MSRLWGLHNDAISLAWPEQWASLACRGCRRSLVPCITGDQLCTDPAGLQGSQCPNIFVEIGPITRSRPASSKHVSRVLRRHPSGRNAVSMAGTNRHHTGPGINAEITKYLYIDR